MPVNPALNFNFDPMQQTAINSGLDAVLSALSGPTVPYVNLTAAERRNTPSISNERLPYVQDAVQNILPLFPALASPSVALSRTNTLLQLAIFVRSLQPKIAEIQDRLNDMSINAETLVYESMRDSYDTAQRQEGRLPGADVLKAAVEPLFAGQGTPVPQPVPVP